MLIRLCAHMINIDIHTDLPYNLRYVILQLSLNNILLLLFHNGSFIIRPPSLLHLNIYHKTKSIVLQFNQLYVQLLFLVLSMLLLYAIHLCFIFTNEYDNNFFSRCSAMNCIYGYNLSPSLYPHPSPCACQKTLMLSSKGTKAAI